MCMWEAACWEWEKNLPRLSEFPNEDDFASLCHYYILLSKYFWELFSVDVFVCVGYFNKNVATICFGIWPPLILLVLTRVRNFLPDTAFLSIYVY